MLPVNKGTTNNDRVKEAIEGTLDPGACRDNFRERGSALRTSTSEWADDTPGISAGSSGMSTFGFVW
jgi:hypothetical protein